MTRDARAWIAGIAVALLVALVAACGGARVACPAADLAPRGEAFLWRVAGRGGGELWLYGTFHNGRARVPAVATAALERAVRFASELGDAEPDADRLHAAMRIASGKALDALLPADDWYDLRDALRGVVREDVLRRARPWFALSQLTAALAPSPRPTMDVALAARARARGIPVEALESWDQQLAALATAVTVEDLQQAIRERRTLACSVERILDAYAAGDLDAMGRLLGASAAETLLAARNRRWLPQLERLAAGPGPVFVAVGVSHLAGPEGLPALFARAGYEVVRVAGTLGR